MAKAIQWREPEIFPTGDTLIFQRSLPDYPAGAGWKLELTLTFPTPQGGQQKGKWDSVASGDLHTFNIPAFGAGLVAGTYILANFAINGAERHRIYYGELELVPDLDAGAVGAPMQTFAQQAITALRQQYLAVVNHAMQETDVQRTRFLWAKRKEIREELCFWEERRAFELNVQAVRNGQGNRQQIVPAFNCG